MSTNVPVILEHIAATGWFAEHGEVALTAGLTFCLKKDPAAAQAFVELIRTRTGQREEDIPVPDRWQAEAVVDKGGRVDVAGWQDTAAGPAPIVVVEAKISAAFAPRQVSSYVESQKRSLQRADIPAGALAVLVPAARIRATRNEVAADLGRLDVRRQSGCWVIDSDSRVSVTVISWDEAIDAMLVDDGPAACDLAQLRGACRALQGVDVAALTEADLAGEWRRNRKEDLRLLIDRVTREAIAQLSLPFAPWQPNPSGGLDGGFRYLPPPDGGFRYLAPPDLPNLAVGMRQDELSPPLWVRWHSQYADMGVVESRLTEAGHTPQRHQGHIWLPLKIKPASGSATDQIEELVLQIVALYKTAVNWDDHA